MPRRLMNFIWTTRARRFGRLAAMGLVVLGLTNRAAGQAAPAPLPTLPAAAPGPGQSESTGETQVEYQGVVQPGARINLNLQGVESPGARYEWLQVEGPPVEIDRPNEPVIKLVVPADAKRLAFLFTVADGRGTRRFRVNVPVQVSTADEPPPDPSACVAEGGDDQIGLVGRRLTLDGSQSRPAAGLALRWLQVSGPAAGSPRQNGPYYSFIPGSPGLYRFALVVAAAGTISEPDYVTVTVGDLPTPGAAPAAARPDPARSVLETALRGIALMPEGPRTAGLLADAFEGAAAFVPQARNFAAVQAELVARCDAAVPPDAALRALWSRSVLEPLSQYTVARLGPAGIDLRQPTTTQQPLSPDQQQQINDTLTSIAAGLRTRSATR